MSDNTKLRWGLLNTGSIAKAFANGVRKSELGILTAVGSRSLESAQRFASEFEIPKAHGSYEALLADPEVDAVYISTPHPHHAAWAVKAAEAGKHVLCEKPLTMNAAEAMVVEAAARENDVLLMEAFMFRCSPLCAKLVEIVESGVLGELRVIEAVFSFKAGFNPEGRLFNNALGGGGILDVGCYTMTAARRLAGAALGLPFAEPLELRGSANLLETGVDGWAVASLKFPGGILAQLSTGVQLQQENRIVLVGTEATLRSKNPWIPAKEGGSNLIELERPGHKAEEILVESAEWLYGIEADTFARAALAGLRDVPELPIADTVGNMRALDQWRQSAGLTYEAEKPSNTFIPIKGRPLRVDRGMMKYARIPGLDKELSRLIMGCDNQRTMTHAAAMFDDFYERGGNFFDTAHIYGGGTQERLLGHWIHSRGVRDEVAVIVKGAHTPFCDPQNLHAQFQESLERLQTDQADVYVMHRDNESVPVGEFVDALNALQSEGKIGLFGGSNWSIRRTEEANTYAKAKGLKGFSVLSNNFSLARMVSPVWAGCVSASDDASRAWLRDTGTALLCWSSQARGFFTERAGQDKLDDQELVRCWYSPENFQRRDRALELAKQKGVSPIAVALAYVLSQDFSSFALIGPRVIAETVSSLEGLKIDLSPEEVAWLDLRD